jgi:hypothetical protein
MIAASCQTWRREAESPPADVAVLVLDLRWNASSRSTLSGRRSAISSWTRVTISVLPARPDGGEARVVTGLENNPRVFPRYKRRLCKPSHMISGRLGWAMIG